MVGVEKGRDTLNTQHTFPRLREWETMFLHRCNFFGKNVIGSFWSPLYNDQMIPKPLTGSGLKNRENTKRSFYVWQCHYSMSLFFNPKTLRPRPNVSVFVWTWIFFLRFGPPSTHIWWKRSPKTDLFKNALQPGWKFLKTPAFCLRVDGRRRRTVFKYDGVIYHIPQILYKAPREADFFQAL